LFKIAAKYYEVCLYTKLGLVSLMYLRSWKWPAMILVSIYR